MISYIFTLLQYFVCLNLTIQIYVGVDEVDDGKRSLDDKPRIDYISHHLLYLQRAIMWV